MVDGVSVSSAGRRRRRRVSATRSGQLRRRGCSAHRPVRRPLLVVRTGDVGAEALGAASGAEFGGVAEGVVAGSNVVASGFVACLVVGAVAVVSVAAGEVEATIGSVVVAVAAAKTRQAQAAKVKGHLQTTAGTRATRTGVARDTEEFRSS